MPSRAAAAASGRIEVLGNHTDYNGGLVLVAPTPLRVEVAGERSDDGRIRLHSERLGRSVEVERETFDPLTGEDTWANYFLGAVEAMEQLGVVFSGLDVRISGDLPLGAGLASSAALGVATVRFLAALHGVEIAPRDVATIVQAAENDFAGVPCGPLDPLSCASLPDGASWAFLDFGPRETEIELLPAPAGLRLLVFDSGARHDLAAGDYARRRSECEAAAAAFGVAKLGALTLGAFEQKVTEIDPLLARRAWHIVTENARVGFVRGVLRNAIPPAMLGEYLGLSHLSSLDYFENSSPEQDHLVEHLMLLPGVLGARLTGGGFGGAVLALVEEAVVDSVTEKAEVPRIV